ncbi:MAG: hypothetical protein A3C13_02040 [Candidatus Lloydbacteria bacterium RIFCSPHIGHO2_02_FULL_50_11]|nr:MAG: hypothetical protein A3C13_02040 [Candidatus Lloydbacteria bacterium RIFCSPHIGHO2_02_FULL_50_11]
MNEVRSVVHKKLSTYCEDFWMQFALKIIGKSDAIRRFGQQKISFIFSMKHAKARKKHLHAVQKYCV